MNLLIYFRQKGGKEESLTKWLERDFLRAEISEALGVR